MTELLGAIQEVETAADYLKTQPDAIRDNEEIESGILREAIRHNKEKLEQLAKAAKKIQELSAPYSWLVLLALFPGPLPRSRSKTDVSTCNVMSRWLASLEGEQHVTTARDNRKIGL